MITRQQVAQAASLRIQPHQWNPTITLSEREYQILCTAALKARYTHINKKADSDPLYECGMDYLEETEF